MKQVTELTDRKVGRRPSVHGEQLLVIGAQGATLKPGMLRNRCVCKVPEARNSCFLLKAGRSSWGSCWWTAFSTMWRLAPVWRTRRKQCEWAQVIQSEHKGGWRLRALYGTDWRREVSALDAMIRGRLFTEILKIKITESGFVFYCHLHFQFSTMSVIRTPWEDLLFRVLNDY